MNSNSYRVVLVSLLMIFSSLAGCLDGDDDESREGKYGTVMVSTYHVGELVNAVAGTSVYVEMMSEDNIPVHDYEPSAQDVVRLQGVDVFFYHGLGLEPWVDSTLESMGEAAPTAIGTHAMPGDEATLDYEGMLISELCELLTAGPYEATTLSMEEDGASEIHAEYVAHTLSFPEMDDDHDDHADDDHDDHGEHGDEHDEHNHADHGHASPEETIEDPAGCPADSVISIFHMEEGEYILEFEEAEDLHEFNMAVLKMNGGHAHHDHHGHGDHDDHGDDDHDDHGDEDRDHDDHGDEDHDRDDHDEHDDHDDHGDDHDEHDDHGDEHDDHDEPMTPEHAIESFDMDNDNHISWDEFWNSWGEDDHDEHAHTVSVLYPDNTTTVYHVEHDMLPENATGWDLTNMTMSANNISLNYSVHEQYGHSVTGINGVDSPDDWSWYWSLQVWNVSSDAWEASAVGIDSIMMTHDDNDHIAWAASTANMSLLEEPGHHDGHGEHDDHGDHDDDHGDEDHEDHGVCYNSDWQMVSGLDNETTCEAYTYMTNVSWGQTTFTGCYNPVSHAADANMSEETCAAFMWMDEHSYDEMVALMGIFMGSDMDNDSLLSLVELEHFIERIEHFEDSHDDEHAGHVKIHIEAEGDYGFALPHDVEFYVLMGERGHGDHDDHDDRSDGAHDGYSDDEPRCSVDADCPDDKICEIGWCVEGPDQHDEDDMVCYDMSTHTVDATYTNEDDCETAGLMWTAANSGPGGDDHDDHGDEEDHGDHDDHADEETLNYDPHSWLDPVAFKVQMNIVLDGLIAAFPSGEDEFRANAEEFGVELDALDDAYDAAFGENGTCAAGQKTVAANHNAYSYIAVRYDIQFVTVHGLDPEGEPSPGDIANVVSHINEEGLTVLFVEEFTDPSSVGSIMQDTGVTILYLYTMEMAPIDASDNYLSLMNKNLDNLVAGIGC
tara:strand:+ start:1016 stop:3853 length:2838 start_codon:yes stop_codon:yes gene_type:complete